MINHSLLVTRVLVTGSNGFIGKNLVQALKRTAGIQIMTYDVNDQRSVLDEHLVKADVIYHLAGVNRPERPEEFEEVNVGLTKEITALVTQAGTRPLIVFSSSTQAELDNPYGLSKRKAEEVLRTYAVSGGARVIIYRLPGVFGKWCRPNYNSVVATFCYNIAHNLPITISDPEREIEIVYIDDVVREMIRQVRSEEVMSDEVRGDKVIWGEVKPVFRVKLGVLAEMINEFRATRQNLTVPDFSARFTKCLYATYLSYLDDNDFVYELKLKTDERGQLAELLKSEHFGQIFVSRTKPGVTRGNHYHNTKTEKFCVVVGEAIVRFRKVTSDEVIEYRVSGQDFKVIDIPPGYTHSIENVGGKELVVLFWACEPYDPAEPDSYSEPVFKTHHKGHQDREGNTAQ